MPEHEGLNQALLDAVIGNETLMVKNLLEKGANPNYFEDDAQIRPLHFAAMYDSPDVVPLLIVAGADLHAETEYSDTPLMIAERHEHLSVMGVLHRFYGSLVDHPTRQ